MELTKVEKALVEAYRDGADLRAVYHNVETPDKAIDKVLKFGRVTDFLDLTERGDIHFISIENNEHKNLSVMAFVEIEKATHGNE